MQEEEGPASLQVPTQAALHQTCSVLHQTEAAAVAVEHRAPSSSPTATATTIPIPSTTISNTSTDPALASFAAAVAYSQKVDTLKHGLSETLLEHILELLLGSGGETGGLSLEGRQNNGAPAAAADSTGGRDSQNAEEEEEEGEAALRVLQTKSGTESPAVFSSRCRHAMQKAHWNALAGGASSSCGGWRDFFFAGLVSALVLIALARRGLA